jgi:hopanoid C-2 methylase
MGVRTSNGSSVKLAVCSPRKRVLIVNCYFDDTRRPIRRTTKIPQAVGPIYLAGAFDRILCDVVCYTELASGPLEDEHLFSWPDMLVVTGLTNSLDRMLHLTAYARTKNPKVIVVAGGPPVRALPLLSKRFFDYSCLGDLEEIREVIVDTFGSAYVAQQMIPRYDLAYWLGRTGYVESTRNCNFHCSFCSLTGEGRAYQTYDLDHIRREIVACGRRKRLFFLDNNFYGNSRAHFRARIELINELRSAGQFSNWSALVTNDFFRYDENLTLAKHSGCELLFSGVESFDTRWLRSVNKLQNTSVPQVNLIRKCLDAGIVFTYGLILDVTNRHVADLRHELEFVMATPEITLPSFVSLPIPLLGTPYFFDCLKKKTILPATRLRDLDGTTVSQTPLDPIGEVVEFLDDLQDFRGFRRRVISHSFQFARLYRTKLGTMQMCVALGNNLLLCAYNLGTSPGFRRRKDSEPRTFISSTEPLDALYKPAFPVTSRFEHYFQPTMVTDANGQLHEDVAELTASGTGALHARADLPVN